MIDGLSTDTRLAIEYHLHLSSSCEPKALRNANLDESDILNEMAECGALASLPRIDWNQILGATPCANQ